MEKKHIAVNIIAVVLILAGIAWIASIFVHPGGEYTDNAQIRKDIVGVSSRVQGFIEEVRFEDFSHVCKGDTLALIEDAQYRLYYAQAKANYENALVGKTAMGTSISATSNNIAMTESAIEEVRIQLANAESEYKRYSTLLATGAVTKQQYDAVKTQYDALKAKVETMQKQKGTTTIARTEQVQRLQQSEAGIDICKAALDLAELNLSYTVITAPCDGITSAKSIQEGELVMPGTPLLAVISDERPWVIANYRETQLDGIEVGSKVVVKVDALHSLKLEGEVCSISYATGAQMSRMAPDNATGNFVKIEQRVPVKIVFTENNSAEDLARLSSGMNVTCKVLR